MDVNNIASLASNMSQAALSQEVSLTVFKKALDVESASVLSLIAALPPVQSAANLPAHLGQNINTVA